MIHGQKYTIAALYALNSRMFAFLSDTLKQLLDFREGMVLLGGDFNIVLDPYLDSSSGKTSISFRALKHIRKLLRELHLVNCWRVTNVKVKDFSYNSKTHDTYFRLDLIFVDQFYLSNVTSSSIGSITISDHSLSLSLCIYPPNAQQRVRTW